VEFGGGEADVLGEPLVWPEAPVVGGSDGADDDPQGVVGWRHRLGAEFIPAGIMTRKAGLGKPDGLLGKIPGLAGGVDEKFRRGSETAMVFGCRSRPLHHAGNGRARDRTGVGPL
jgi:hypothetical protein